MNLNEEVYILHHKLKFIIYLKQVWLYNLNSLPKSWMLCKSA